MAICKTFDSEYASKETQGALALARFTAESIAKGIVSDLSLPQSLKDIRDTQTRIMLSEMSRSLAFEFDHFHKKLSPLLIKQIQAGSQIAYAQYSQDLIYAQEAIATIHSLFVNEVDIIIAPSAIGEAPLIKDGTGDPIFCRGWTLLGLPCINLTIATGSNGLPVGVQLIAGPGKDRFLLSVARAFAKAMPDPVLREQA